VLPADPLADLESFKSALGSWRPALSSYLETASFGKLFRYVQAEYASTVCFPPKALIFNAFNKATFSDLKIVIVG